MNSKLAVVFACLGLGVSLLGCENKSKAPKAEEAVPVVVATAQLIDVPREVATFGVVEASSSVDVAPQVQGLVTEVHFKEGDFVKRGDLLFTVDTRPYRASLAAAQVFSQLLTLYVAPVFYLYLEGLRERFARRKHAAVPGELQPAAGTS